MNSKMPRRRLIMINEILNVTGNVLIDDNGEVITISKVASKQKSTKKPLIVEETTLGLP